MNKPEQIPDTCKRCSYKRCIGLHWERSLVFSEYFAVPLDCPLRVNDLSQISWELRSLNDYKISHIAGKIWVEHNVGTRYSNGTQGEIQHILYHFRNSKCVMIARSQNPYYHPWKLFGFWADSNSVLEKKPLEKKTSEVQPQEITEATVTPKPIEITASGMEHLDQLLQKEHYRNVAQGDKMKLLAEVDGAPDGERIKFELYYSTSKSGSTHFDTVVGEIKDGIGSAEWTVDLSEPLKDCDTFELKHEPVVRGKYGKPCPIGRRELAETATCPLDVREYAIENFRRLIGFPWDNDRIEVFDPSDCIDKIKHPLQPHLLPYEGANNDGKETDTPTVVPDEKWLYAFSKKGDKDFISESFETVGSDGKAKYQHVSWKNAESHKDTYPRKTEQEKKDSFLVPAESETVIFISDHQLTYARVLEYQSDNALLKQRGCTLNSADLKKDTPLEIVLPDIVGIGEHLAYKHAENAVSFNKYLESLQDRLKEPNEDSRRQFANMLQQLADKHPVVKSNIHYDKLIEYNIEFEREQEERKLTLDWFCKMLCNWLKTEEYQITRNDYCGNDELEETLIEREASWTENLSRTESGATFLAEEANDEESWYYQVNEGSIGFKQLLTSSRFTNSVKENLIDLKLTILQGKVNALVSEKFKYTTKAQRYTWESAQALEQRNDALQEFRALKNKKGTITRHQLRARQKLVKYEIKKLLKSHNLSLNISDNIDFINENSDKLIYNCGLKPTGKQKITTEKAIKSVEGRALLEDARGKSAEAAKMKSRAATAEFEADEVRSQIDSIKTSSLNVITNKIFIAIEHVNVVLAVQSFRSTWAEGDAIKSSFEAVSTLGALVDIGKESEFVIEALSPARQPLHTRRLYTKSLTKIKELSARQITIYRLDAVSGICDIVVCGYNIYNYWQDDKKRQIIGESIICIGKVMGTATAIGTLVTGKAVGDVLFLGVTTGGWGLIASGVVLAGALIAYVLREKPLRDWARQCPFNNLTETLQLHDVSNAVVDKLNLPDSWEKKEKPFSIEDYTDLLEDEIDIQRQKLFAILAEFTVEFHTALQRVQALPSDLWKFKTFQISIAPQALHKNKSKFLADISVIADKSIYSSEFPVLKDSVVLDHETNCLNGSSKIEVSYSLEELAKIAFSNGYKSKEFDEFIETMKYKKYVSKKPELDDYINGLYVYSDYEIKADVKVRLDYEGTCIEYETAKKNEYIALIESDETGSGRLVIPIKSSERFKKRNPKYAFS